MRSKLDAGRSCSARLWATILLAAIAAADEAHAVEPSEPAGRPLWTSSRVKGTPDPPPPMKIQRVFEDVPLRSPTEMIRVPGTDRWIVCELGGRIHSFAKTLPRKPAVALNVKDVAPLSNQLYGITFHPQYPEQPWCYICFKAEKNSRSGTRLSRFRVTDTEVPIIDPKSETVYTEWNSEGHSGGSLHFGKDGYLYVSVGDGQNPNPPDRLNTGQDLSDFEASILRIDVDRTQGDLPYAIPADNPFIDRPGVRPEIWAYGLRNPWKMAFDPVSDTLWTADVGWEMMEMVYRIDRGGNYGWSIKEGSQIVKADHPDPIVPITPPIVEHTHLESRSVTGGYFWYSERLPQLHGAYIYGDWMTGKIWGVRHDGKDVTWHQELADTTIRVICFASDDGGEVLVVGYDGGVYRLVANETDAASAEFPRRLSDTGLFESTERQTPAPGVIAYDINAKHWADHTESRQWIGLTSATPLTVHGTSDWKTGQSAGHFDFPHDTVFAKTVSYRRDPGDPASLVHLETQLLHRYGDEWKAYNYIWNEEQTDAELQENTASTRELAIVDPDQPDGIRKQSWLHASRDQCLLCHIWRAGTVHGFKLNQLASLDSGTSELARMQAMGIVDAGLSHGEPMVSPYDDSLPLDQRARSYLHLNCAHCHRRGGGGTAPFELVGDLPLQQLSIVDVPPSQGDFGLSDPCVVAAGDPSRSVLMYRMVKSGRGHMPQFGPNLIDQSGVRLIRDWIATLEPSSVNDRSSGIDIAENPETIEPEAIARTLSDPRSSLDLALKCFDPQVSPSRRIAIAEIASEYSAPHAPDLFESFLPADRRVQRLGSIIDVERLLAAEGDAVRGAKLFREAADVNCRQCHRIGDVGVAVGPDLGNLGNQRTRREILESLVDPSAKIEEKYRGKVLVTVDGNVISGLVIRETDQRIEVLETSGKTRQVSAEDVEAVKAMQKSVMPDMLLSQFTAQQAADLLAFLAAQRSGPAP